MSKKLLIVLFFFSLSTEIFSEEYICSISWKGEVRTTTYLREGNSFIQTDRFGIQEKFIVIKETDTTLYLHDEPNLNGILITIIDKKDKKYSHNYLVLGLDESKGNEGTCLIRD